MAATLLIRLGGEAQPLEWLALDERGRGAGASRRGDAPPAAELARAARVVVLVPAEDCVLLEASLPARSREQWLKALPYALEDQLAEPVEQLHFGVGPRAEGVVVAVRRERLASWMAELARRGIVPDAMLPDLLGLAPEPGGMALLLERGRALVRLGPAAGFAAEPSLLPALLARVRAGLAADAPERVLAAPGADVAGHPGAEPCDALSALAGAIDPQLPNLLVGAFAARHRGAPVRRLWRIAGALAAALAVLAQGFLLLDRWQLEHRAEALRAEMAGIYRQVYPEGRIEGVDLAGRMRAELGGAREASGGGLALLGRIAPVLAGDSRVLLTGIDFRNGVMELAVLGPDVGTLDGLRGRVATSPGLAVELTAASATERGAEGRLRISEGAP